MVFGPTVSTLPFKVKVGAILTEFPLLILKVFGDNRFSVCTVWAGKLTVLVFGPTVSTLPVNDKVGAMATEFPPEMLKLLGLNNVKEGVAEIEKFG